jgi:uncharacterized protein YdhG (YjbR/CyaY superfamily)
METFETVDAYINAQPLEVRDILQTLRQTIKEEIPGVEETMSYKMPTFTLHGNYVIYFAAWKKHISLYPFSNAMEKSLKEASAYKTSGKGTIQFPLDKPLPLSLIREIVRFRLKEVQEKN